MAQSVIAHYGASMEPGTSGRIKLLDGTVILASGSHHVMGDPIKRSLTVNGHRVTFDAVGLAAVRLNEQGEVEALAAGGLKLFATGDMKIEGPRRMDLALWRNSDGEWQGILHDTPGFLPQPDNTLLQSPYRYFNV